MKTQLQKPSAGKARYSVEYKREALEHWKSSGRSAAKVAAELGIRAPLLYRWARQFRLAVQQGRQPELDRCQCNGGGDPTVDRGEREAARAA